MTPFFKRSARTVRDTLARMYWHIRPAYTWRGIVFRMFVDLALVNIGFLISYLSSIIYYVSIRNHKAAEMVVDKLWSNWQHAAPIFSASCLVLFFASGLYHCGYLDKGYHRAMITLRALASAMVMHVMLVLFFDPEMIPTVSQKYTSLSVAWSMTAIGWSFIVLTILVTRLGSTLIHGAYMIVPRQDASGVAKTIQNLTEVISEPSHLTTVFELPMHTLLSPRFLLWPFFDQNDMNRVGEVLRSGKVNRWTGNCNITFERIFADFCHTEYAIAVANGTVALELALHAIEIGPGDEVIVPCRTFIASASAVVMRGATPVMADVDRQSQNITAQTIADVLTPKTKAVIVVHLNGWPCEMDPIMTLAQQHGLKIIEDCAQAHGAMYKGRPVGSMGDVGAFSFCQDKIMTTGGEGGMVVTDDQHIWRRAWSYKDHGKDYDTVFNTEHPPGFRWLHHDFGTNWRMTEMQAVLGLSLMEKLPKWVAERRRLASVLIKGLENTPGLRVVRPPGYIHHAYYKFYVFVEPDQLAEGWDRDRIMNAIIERGIPCFSGICGQIHKELAFEKHNLLPDRTLVHAQELEQTALMFLVHPTLRTFDMRLVVHTVRQVMAEATA